jgi:hypothetical protein
MKSDNPSKLSENPTVSILPNPATTGKVFFIRSDRNMTAQIISVLGQKISDSFQVTANEDYLVNAASLSTGVYIVRLTWNNKSFALRVIIP